MDPKEKLKLERELIARYSNGFNLLLGRVGLSSDPNFKGHSIPGVNDLAHYLGQKGGLTQQERMIRDKRKSLDKAVLYSYQGAFVKKHYPDDIEFMEGAQETEPVRALINPNKLKQDYDDKIISIGYEYGFTTGDIFEWVGTNTRWLIYLQDLTELAYFRGDIRKCSHEISWTDEEGKHTTYAAIRGPVETKINFIQKHGISVDTPSYSLSILLPKNESTLKYFQRYKKFYLTSDEDSKICWRVEAIDWLSTPGILEVIAVEYYANETEDDIENGVVGGLIVEPTNPNDQETEEIIVGDTFIKPKKVYTYYFTGHLDTDEDGHEIDPVWSIEGKAPVQLEQSGRTVAVRWLNTYSGQFNLLMNGTHSKTIVVQSLF